MLLLLQGLWLGHLSGSRARHKESSTVLQERNLARRDHLRYRHSSIVANRVIGKVEKDQRRHGVHRDGLAESAGTSGCEAVAG